MNIETKHKCAFAVMILFLTAVWVSLEFSIESVVVLLMEGAAFLLFILHKPRLYILILTVLISFVLGVVLVIVLNTLHKKQLPDAVVDAPKLEFYDGPSTAYMVLGSFMKGTHLQVIAKDRDPFTGWLKVRDIDGRSGWIPMRRDMLWINIQLSDVAIEPMPVFNAPTPLCHP